MVPHHPQREGRPERCSRADDNKPPRVLPRPPETARCVWVFWQGIRFVWRLVKILALRTFGIKTLCGWFLLRFLITTGAAWQPKVSDHKKTSAAALQRMAG